MSDDSTFAAPQTPDEPPADAQLDGPGEPIRWVTVAHFFDPEHAHIARLRLADEQIPCFIADEYAVGTLWQDAIALGGAKLKVPVDSAPAAESALACAAFVAPPLLDGRDRCPRCGSSDVGDGHSARRFLCMMLVACLLVDPLLIAAALAGGTVYLMATRTRCCLECGFEWPKGSRNTETIPTSDPLANEDSDNEKAP